MALRKKDSKNNIEINDRIEILRKVIIFSESDNKILKQLANSLDDVYVKLNEVVFRKGDHLNAMYIIKEGSVIVHDGDHIFTQFGKNDFFGEYSLIDSSARSATVTANKETQLLRLNQQDFNKIIETNHDVAKAILKALIKRLRNNNILEERLTQHSIKIEKQKQELEELNATKDKFFTIIAHDLKNPFNTVIGLSELLMERYDTYDQAKIKEFIYQINKFTINAYELLEELLQWAKSQTGRLEVKKEVIDLYEIINSNIELFTKKAEKKNTKIISKVSKNTIAFIDKNMISTVIRNFISNAVKFTENGTITIEAKKNNENIEISVVDSGLGISEENLKHLFRIDKNISTPGTNEETGTGLGLIISKEFIKCNDGSIEVDSDEGKGSTFKFSVPVK